MTIDTIIERKRLNNNLTYEELVYAFNGYLKDNISDASMTQLLKMILVNGMSNEEIFNLTDIFIKSGKVLDLSEIPYTIDKHSTGGVGDKTTLIVAPLVAACGAYVPKMSGRGLGYTGGTIDKLESFKGIKLELDSKKYVELIKKNGFAICSQSKDLVPMDAKVYALRDVTGTTNSIPLIAVSIMSKKIACGAKNIIIDVKYGSGALLANKKEAKELSKIMIAIGNKYNRKVKTKLTDMNSPLGCTIGNSLEVIEAIKVLKGTINNDLTSLCIELACEMLSMAKNISIRKAKKAIKNAINNGEGYKHFESFVKDQEGDINSLKVSEKKQYIISPKKGIVKEINALAFGKLSVALGAGRQNKGDKIDYTVGITLNKKIGDKVKIGELLCTLYIKGDFYKEDVTNYFFIK